MATRNRKKHEIHPIRNPQKHHKRQSITRKDNMALKMAFPNSNLYRSDPLDFFSNRGHPRPKIRPKIFTILLQHPQKKPARNRRPSQKKPK